MDFPQKNKDIIEENKKYLYYLYYLIFEENLK